MTDNITASPLTWPKGYDRTLEPEPSRFGRYDSRITLAKATRFVLNQLRMMGVDQDDVIISSNLKTRQDGLPYSNQRTPDDVGISVWWMEGKEQKVLPRDKYDRIADNLYAIGKVFEAGRGIERWGGGEIRNKMFDGFVALPDNSYDWRSVLGHADTLEDARKLYRIHRSAAHPDNGGSPESFIAYAKAWEAAQAEFSME